MVKRRGRPPSFDRGEALKKAMGIFWAKGYEGTQLVDLTAAMGINPPSFYAAFGSKLTLFYEVVNLYIDTIGCKTVQALNEAKTAEAGINAMLNNAIINASSSESGGCLMVMGVVNSLSENHDAWTFLKVERLKTLSIIEKRILRGIEEGDLPEETDAKTLSEHFLGVTQAISFQARDGASREDLQRLIKPAMAALRGSGV